MRGRRAVLLLKETSGQTKVEKFLESIARSGLQTMRVYKIGLSYFQKFLGTYGDGFTLESIINPLANNEINVYLPWTTLYPIF